MLILSFVGIESSHCEKQIKLIKCLGIFIAKTMMRELSESKVREWLYSLRGRLKRVTTRSFECRLIEAVERMDFERNKFAQEWTTVEFKKKKNRKSFILSGFLYDKNENLLERFLPSSYILFLLGKVFDMKKCDDEELILIRRNLQAEKGYWAKGNTLEKSVIAEGGEAIVFKSRIRTFGKIVVRVQSFDSALFTKNFKKKEYVYKINLFSNYVRADGSNNDNDKSIPVCDFIVKNYANIEIFHTSDCYKIDCLGWITIMEKCGEHLRSKLKSEKLNLAERIQIALNVKHGIEYLNDIGIEHCDLKLENVLVRKNEVKIIDFGLTKENSGKKGFREMGYVRKGSKFRKIGSLRKLKWENEKNIIIKELDLLHFVKQAKLSEQQAIHGKIFMFSYFRTGSPLGLFYLIQSKMKVEFLLIKLLRYFLYFF